MNKEKKKPVILWSKPGCELCVAAKQQIDALGLDLELRNIDKLLAGALTAEALYFMTALQMHDGRYPLIQIGGEYYEFEEALPRLDEMQEKKDA